METHSRSTLTDCATAEVKAGMQMVRKTIVVPIRPAWSLVYTPGGGKMAHFDSDIIFQPVFTMVDQRTGSKTEASSGILIMTTDMNPDYKKCTPKTGQSGPTM